MKLRDEIAALRSLDEKAQPAPWRYEWSGTSGRVVQWVDDGSVWRNFVNGNDDANNELICAMRNRLRRVLDFHDKAVAALRALDHTYLGSTLPAEVLALLDKEVE